MEALEPSEIHRLDQLGAHFKFRDMCARLRTVIGEHKQEKRSSDLLQYQAYFTQNQPQSRQKTGSQTAAKRRSQVKKELAEKASSLNRRDGSIKAAAHSIGSSVGEGSLQPQGRQISSFTVRDIDPGTGLPQGKKYVKGNGAVDRISINLANQQQQAVVQSLGRAQGLPGASSTTTNIVHLNANQLNLVVGNIGGQNSASSQMDAANKILSSVTGIQPNKVRQSQQESSYPQRIRHSSLDELSDYVQNQPLNVGRNNNFNASNTFHHQNNQGLSKMSSGNRLRNQAQHRSALDYYSTSSNFGHKNLSNKKDQRLTIDNSPMRFNIGQIRAASVMETDNDARVANKRAKQTEKLMPMMGQTQIIGRMQAEQNEYGVGNQNGKLPVKMHQRLLPKM